LLRFSGALARAPVDARLDLDKHLKLPDQEGRELDVDASFEQLAKGAHGDEETVELVTKRISAKVTLEKLGRVDVTKTLSAFETTFSLFGTGLGRATNIRRAAALFDGAVLSPGEVLSFNDKVGPRTPERGFVLAPEIQQDEMQLGYGGGTCQAS